MSLGAAPYMLMHAAEVFQGNTPSKKITAPGYIRKLLPTKANIISKGIDDGSGHVRDTKIKFRTRVKSGATSQTDSCDIDGRPIYSEATLSATLYRKYAIFIDNDTIRTYEKEASSRVQNVNGIPTLKGVSPLMKDHFDAIVESANALLGDMNSDLLAKQISLFGVNTVSGSAAAVTVNFPLTINGSLSEGMTKVMNHIRENEMMNGNVDIVGSGLIASYYDQLPARSADNSGLNIAQLARPEFFYDGYAGSQWGTNKFGLFERNSVQFIDINRFGANTSFSGIMGASYFGVLPLPVMDSQGNMISVDFDFQLKAVDCPTEYPVAGYESNQTINRGWVLILSKSFDQFNIPSDAYETGDRMEGNNGTLLFTATNS